MIRARLAALAFAALLVLCSFGATAGQAPVVILLSWDGVRHDYPERTELPALARMQRDGARAERLTPVFPSLTFPNHVTLATGTYPDRHGIVSNNFSDAKGNAYSSSEDAAWLEAEPIWVAAERQGVHTAVFFWVGSETDWRGRGATYRVRPFDAKVPESRKVEQILAWLDLPPGERPGLIMSYWHGCDGVGHEKGPNSPEIALQLAAEDRELGRLLAGLDARGAWPYTTVIVTSDHGMVESAEQIELEPLLADAGIRARVAYSGGEAQVYLADPGQVDAALAALSGHTGYRAYKSDALPPPLLSRSHFPGRGGQIEAVAEPPYALVKRDSRLWSRLRSWLGVGPVRGFHGYDPAHPDMGAIFFALGRGVPAGARLGEVRSIDVAPTAAALLGIAPPASSEGKALFGPSRE